MQPFENGRQTAGFCWNTNHASAPNANANNPISEEKSLSLLEPQSNNTSNFQEIQTLPRFLAENQRKFCGKNYTFTDFIAACQAGELAKVQQWINEEPKSLYNIDKIGQTWLFFSVHQLELLKWFHQRDNTLLDKFRNDGSSVMHLAAANGCVDSMKWIYLQKPHFIEHQNQAGKTPLQVAALTEQISILRLFNRHIKRQTSFHLFVAENPCHKTLVFLLEIGINPNTTNSLKQTLLHIASQYGLVDHAVTLLQYGAKADVFDAYHRLPFDLAILNRQENFIRFFFHVPPERNIEPLPSLDVEGYYYKRLLQARKEEHVEEQVLYLQSISYLYIEKKELITGAKILNCALAQLNKLPEEKNHLPLLRQYLFKRLEQIEVMFLVSKEITPGHKQSLSDLRDRIQTIRSLCKNYVGRYPVQKILANLTTRFQALLSELITEIQQMLGKPPVKWACMGMGSMARYEMCPYSDVEFAFLIENETEEAMEYFRSLSQILELRIINLGETKYPIFGDNYPSPTPDGFCMDAGGNTPMGVNGVYELIGTPKTLAQFQRVQWMNRSIILPNAMSHVCFVAGEESLISDYNKEKRRVQELIERHGKSNEKTHKILAMHLLAGHIEEFAPSLTKEKEETAAFGIKKELYRPFQEIIASLALFYQLEAKTTFDRIDELVNKGIFSIKAAEKLKQAISHVLTLRLKAHLFYEDEKEFLCHPEQGQSTDPQLMYFNEKTLEILQEIYRVLIPFHQCAKEFLNTQSPKAFSRSAFYDESSLSQGNAYFNNIEYGKSQEALQQAAALNPNDFKVLLNLGDTEIRIGKAEDALTRYFKSLEIVKEKYGEKHQYAASCYCKIGSIYHQLGEYTKSLEFHQKALQIDLQVLGEKHADVGMIFFSIANVYVSLGDYTKALISSKASLRILLPLSGEYHLYVASNYDNIGVIYKNIGNYKESLEYHKKSLGIHLKFSKKNHPGTADSYNKISNVYILLGDYTQALKHCQKALQIRLQIFGENHYHTATSYDSLGRIHLASGDSKQALECFQKALRIFLQTFGENHLDVAMAQSNISAVYVSLKDYKAAFDYCNKALKISLLIVGENSPIVASHYNNIGAIYYYLNNYEKATENAKMSLKILCGLFKKSHPDILNALESLIGIAKNLTSHQCATLKETYTICAETLGRENKLVKELLQLIK